MHSNLSFCPIDTSFSPTLSTGISSTHTRDGVSLKHPIPEGGFGGRASACKISLFRRNMHHYPHVCQLFILGMGLRVNMSKTKVMRCCVRVGQVENSGKKPCGICKKGVVANSIQCTACRAWIHKKCSGVIIIIVLTSVFPCLHGLDGSPL